MSTPEIVEIDSDNEYFTDEDNYEIDYDQDDENSDSEIIKEPEDITAMRNAARDHLSEIYTIVEKRQEVNYKNALEMNQEMQKRLVEVREQLTILQAKITERFQVNEEYLKESLRRPRQSLKDGTFGKINRGEKFYIKGSIYFKDENKRNAPNNEDYLERQQQGEMFPMDCELTSRHVWSITDKMSIIKAIKEQIYDDKSLRKRFKNKNQKLEDMLKICEKSFQIDWVQISVHNLRYRHTPCSCKAMFEVYLHPSLKHDAFTEEENQRLVEATEKFNFQNWAAIAAEVGRRSDYQCFLHYHTTPAFRAPYERWDKSADELLIKSVEASKCNGIINWSQIAYLFPQKSRTSLQQRYHYCLNPTISHAPFTGEEDLLLLAAVREYGTNFAKFPRSLFPNRSVIQIRNRYYNTLATRHKACPWTLEDDRLLLRFVEEHGMQWKKCSELMEHRHTRTSCRGRYMSIQKNMQKNPDFKLEDLTRRPFRMMSSSVTAENWLDKIEELRANPTLTVEETTAPIKKSRQRKRMAAALKKQKEPPVKRPRENKKPIYVERLRQCGVLYHNFFKYAYNFRFGKQPQYTPHELYAAESQQALERFGFAMTIRKDEPSSKCGTHINGLLMQAQRRIELTNIIRQRLPRGKILEPDGQQLAPNYSTLMAMRALCVLSADTLKLREEREKQQTANRISVKVDQPNYMKMEPGATEKMASEIHIKTEVELDVEEVERKDTVTNTTAPSFLASTAVFKETLSQEQFVSSPAIQRFRQRFRALFYQAAGLSRLPPSSVPVSMKGIKNEENVLTSAPDTLNNAANNLVVEPSAPSIVTSASASNIKLEPELHIDQDDNSSCLDVVVKKEKDLDNETDYCMEFS